MNLIEEWKKRTYYFSDPVIWNKRKESLQISADADFEAFLGHLHNKGIHAKEQQFLDRIIATSRLINKDRLAEDATLHPSPLDLVLSAIPIHLLNSYDISCAVHLSAFAMDRPAIREQVLEDLRRTIRTFIKPTVTYEYYVFLKAYVREDGPAAMRDFIVEMAGEEEWIVYFFESYPVLLSILTSFAEYFSTDIDRLLGRLGKDWTEICQTFRLPATAELVQLKLFLGDPHKGWQSTARCSFRQGLQQYDIYYKPKSLAGDLFFNDCMAYLHSLGLERTVLPVKAINKQLYGWQEGVTYSPFPDNGDAGHFFYLQGINLAIAYILNLQDLIADNILVSHGYPVLFDLEMLLEPQWKEGKDLRTRSKAGREFMEGIIKTGMVPSYGFETVNNVGYSNSGISKVSDNEYKVFVPEEDKFALSTFRVKAADHNLPKINGRTIRVNDYCKELEAGFRRGCAFIMNNRASILSFLDACRPAMSRIQCRTLVRLTYSYSGLLNESCYPAYMASHLEYYKLMELLWRGYDEIFVPGQVIQNEIDQLQRNEVPYFFTYADSRHLYDAGEQVVVKDFFKTSGFDFVRQRIAMLNEDTVVQQVNILRRALYIHNDYQVDMEYAYLEQHGTIAPNVHPAEAIGAFLYQLNRSGEAEPYFSYIDYTITKDDLWSQGIQNCDIFQGVEGVGIAFAGLYATFGDPRYLRAAEKIFEQSLELFRNNRNWLLDSPSNKIGITNFPVGTIYYSLIGNRILQKDHFRLEPELLALMLEYITAKYPGDGLYSYFSGSTGALLILMALYEVRKEPEIYQLIRQLGTHLVEHAYRFPNGMLSWEKPFFDKWGGFAHGNSSTAYALFKLAHLSGSEQFQDAAISALQYDQCLLDGEKKIWRKSIDFEGEIHHSWGNGSAGIGMSRVLISRYYSNDLLHEEINIARENIDRHLLGSRQSDHSIGSGFLGMIELRKLLDPEFDPQPIIAQYQHDLRNLQDIKCGGWDRNPLVTGLYYGFAGVGYNLARLTVNPDLPSLLWI